MIVPRTSLLVAVALFAVPVAIVAGTVDGAFGAACIALGLFTGCVLVDGALAGRRLRGIQIQAPALVRFHKDRPGNLELRIANEFKNRRLLRLGLALPREFAIQDQDLLTLLPAGEALVGVKWPCTPLKRGLYGLDRVYLETASALGFWGARKSHPVQVEVRVYPDLFEDRKTVAALFLKRGAIGSQVRRQAGEGREFEKLRDYVHGDSVEDIHWKASARRGRPVTKIFQVERAQEVYVIVDASRLTAREVPMGDGRAKSGILERFVSGGLILGLAAEQQGDQFGLITFSDKVLTFLRAKSGQAHYDACREKLYTLQSQPVTPDFEELFSLIRVKLRKRALLVFLTALDDPLLAESFSKSAELICRQHLVVVNILKPPTADPVFSQEASSLDEIYGHLGGHLQWNQLRLLQRNLRRRAVRMAILEAERLPADLVAQHAQIKARQLV